jgi:hypothetical protein
VFLLSSGSVEGRKVETVGYLSRKKLGVPVLFLTREHATIGDLLSGVVLWSDDLEKCV